MRVGLSAGTYFKGVQVVLVWKYSESEEEPRPPNITLKERHELTLPGTAAGNQCGTAAHT